MPNAQSFLAFRGNPLSRLVNPSPGGFCYRCERVGPWDDLSFHYRCSHCGHDPVETADGIDGPASLIGSAPLATAPAPRRRWAGRFPTRRAPGAPLWPGVGARPSLTR